MYCKKCGHSLLKVMIAGHDRYVCPNIPCELSKTYIHLNPCTSCGGQMYKFAVDEGIAAFECRNDSCKWCGFPIAMDFTQKQRHMHHAKTMAR